MVQDKRVCCLIALPYSFCGPHHGRGSGRALSLDTIMWMGVEDMWVWRSCLPHSTPVFVPLSYSNQSFLPAAVT